MSEVRVTSLWPYLKEMLPESDCWDSLCWLLILSLRTVPKVSAYRPDYSYLFQTVTGDRIKLKTGRTTDDGVGKRSQAGLSLLEDIINSSTSGFCAILSSKIASVSD